MTKIVEGKLQENNQTTLSVESSVEEQLSHKNSAFQKEESIQQIDLGEEVLTDISECVSAFSKGNDNSNGDNSSITSGKLFVKLGKSSQNNDLDKSQSINENSEQTSVNGLLIDIFFFIFSF